MSIGKIIIVAAAEKATRRASVALNHHLHPVDRSIKERKALSLRERAPPFRSFPVDE